MYIVHQLIKSAPGVEGKGDSLLLGDVKVVVTTAEVTDVDQEKVLLLPQADLNHLL